MELKDLLAWLREKMNDEEYADVENFLNGLNSKGAELEELRSSSEVRHNELLSQIDGITKENQSLKARNYDLLMQLPADNEGDGVVEEVVEEDGELYHIDNLFVDPEKEKEE